MILFRLEPSPPLERLLRQAPELGRRAGMLAAKRMAEDYVDAIHGWIGAGRSFVPRTGQLEQSIGWRPTSSGAQVFAGAAHAAWIEGGTRAHVIRPKPGRKALRWFGASGGGASFARQVRHPGTDPLPFFFSDGERRRGLLLAASREAVAETLGAT